MLQDSEITTEHGNPRHSARLGRDGLAQIGASRFDMMGIRFLANSEPNEPTDPADPADPADPVDPADPADPADPGQDPEDPEFDGEFDPKRARTLITKLRAQIAASKAAKAPKDAPDTAKTQAENLRLRVALRTGLDEDLADRLRGTTEEELIEDAEKLLERISPTARKLEDRTPKVQLKGGTQPNQEPETSADDVVSAALGR